MPTNYHGKPHRFKPEPQPWKPPFMCWSDGDFAGGFNVRKMHPLARLMYPFLLMQGWHSDNPPFYSKQGSRSDADGRRAFTERLARHREPSLRDSGRPMTSDGSSTRKRFANTTTRTLNMIETSRTSARRQRPDDVVPYPADHDYEVATCVCEACKSLLHRLCRAERRAG